MSDEEEYQAPKIEDLENEAENNIAEFNKLLDSLSDLHEKKKILWKQIYNNAVLDRRNAYMMYGDLYSKVQGMSAEHAIHGTTLAKYLERMEKSNGQLIKLAEILDEAVEKDEEDMLNEDNYYQNMENYHNSKE